MPELLQTIDDVAEATRQLVNGTVQDTERYEAERRLISLWSTGTHLAPLLALLRSETSKDRHLGCYLLLELSGTTSELNSTVLTLADDDRTCRHAFVAHVWNFDIYSDDVAAKLAARLCDLDLYVRVKAIRWAVAASGDRFEDFAARVKAGTGARDNTFRHADVREFWRASESGRAARALEIVRRLRAGKPVASIRKAVRGEDSFVFDLLAYSERSRNGMWSHQRRGSHPK
jgi:hypothetical protein